MVVNDAAFFLSHREPVAKAARDRGFLVVVATAAGPAVHAVVDAGYEHREIRLTRSGRNPFAEALSVVSLIRLFRSVRPDIVHLVTIKPVLYGGIAARMVGVPSVVSAIPGLGTVFGSVSDSRMSMARFAAKLLYTLALGHRNQRVIFQNSNDRNVLTMMTRLRPDKAIMIPGSGVDLSEYKMADEAETDVPVVVMAARLLRDKGVYEFTEAARILKQDDVRARFLLVGDPDHTNASSVNESQLEAWREEGIVEILGFRSDIASIFAMSHIVVLPSYGEGIPKVLVEAAACGRPVVTTDIPGCREAIAPDQSGLLVPPRDARALADAIKHLIENADLRRRMGRAGRRFAERHFAIEDVIAKHLSTYKALLDGKIPGSQKL
jgi:glycosyltransferase involved in cell wall biosynthesis